MITGIDVNLASGNTFIYVFSELFKVCEIKQLKTVLLMYNIEITKETNIFIW